MPTFTVDCHFKMTTVIKTVVFIQPLIFRWRDRVRKPCNFSLERKPQRLSVVAEVGRRCPPSDFQFAESQWRFSFTSVLTDLDIFTMRTIGTRWFWVLYRGLDLLIHQNFYFLFKTILCLSSKIYIVTSAVLHIDDCGNRVNLWLHITEYQQYFTYMKQEMINPIL